LASPSQSPAPPKGFAFALLVGSLTLGGAVRLWLCFHDDGIFWPDEVFQSLEPAHRLVFGYGLVPWEFIDGARNWALPGLVAALLEVARGLGLSQPGAYLGFVRVAFALMGVATAYGVFVLARHQGAAPEHAAVGAAVFALVTPAIYFAPRAMSETASALPVVLGLAFALEDGGPRWQRWLGASLLGVAVLLRLQNGLFCAGLLGIFAGRRAWRPLGEAAAVLAVWAFAFGLLDKLTWGEWFHSAVVYWRFNFVEGKAAQWGTAAWSFYLRVLWTSAPGAWLLVGVLAAAAYAKARGVLWTALAFFVLHSATAHKEYRFLLPDLPVFCALAGVGLTVLAQRAPPGTANVAMLLTLLSSLFSTARFGQLTFGELGQYEDAKPNASAFDDSGPVNRLLLRAHDVPDLCGLKVEAVHLAWTGGYSYLHRNVPLYPHTGPTRESGFFNYVLTPRRFAPAAATVATEGDLALARIAEACRPDIGYSWRLP
jgi:phosphatidylinositol glycan class B